MGVRFGTAPYLECSSRGDKRFSAFCAPIRCYGNRTIEIIYQASKIFEDGSTNLDWREAKGRAPVNIEYCQELYRNLWHIYISENPKLSLVLVEASGLSDMFGQKNHNCQAEILWHIRNRLLDVDLEEWIARRLEPVQNFSRRK